MSADPKAVALDAAFTALGIASGTVAPVDGAKRLLGHAIDLIPVDQLKEFLSERDRIWADLVADTAEEVKLSGG